ncbi:MAG: response regulator [Alphaproteobacteria bacterium]
MNEQFQHQIMVVDDDIRLRSLLKRFLNKSGYFVVEAEDAANARQKLNFFDVDLMVLDLMMPNESGIEFSQWLFKNRPLPILMLTAMDGPEDRIAGLETGADDYLTKPFETRELLLRIKNILKRQKNSTSEDMDEAIIHMGDLIFDISRRELRNHNDEILHLTEAEKFVLYQMGRTPGVAVSRLGLSANEQDLGRSLDVMITRLRKKINDDPKNPKWIQTVRGQGYMLIPD